MATPVFKHQEDDGNISLFVSGDVVLLACEHGHYWVLDATQHSEDTVKPALENALSTDQAKSLLRLL